MTYIARHIYTPTFVPCLFLTTYRNDLFSLIFVLALYNRRMHFELWDKAVLSVELVLITFE